MFNYSIWDLNASCTEPFLNFKSYFSVGVVPNFQHPTQRCTYTVLGVDNLLFFFCLEQGTNLQAQFNRSIFKLHKNNKVTIYPPDLTSSLTIAR